MEGRHESAAAHALAAVGTVAYMFLASTLYEVIDKTALNRRAIITKEKQKKRVERLRKAKAAGLLPDMEILELEQEVEQAVLLERDGEKEM